MIGTLGQVVFEVSADKVRTTSDFKRKRAANYAEHAVLDRKPILQYVGPALDEISFRIRLDAAQGINPSRELISLEKILLAGDELMLIIGGQPLGKFVLEELNEAWTRQDGQGRLMVAEVDLKLKEYADGN